MELAEVKANCIGTGADLHYAHAESSKLKKELSDAHAQHDEQMSRINAASAQSLQSVHDDVERMKMQRFSLEAQLQNEEESCTSVPSGDIGSALI